MWTIPSLAFGSNSTLNISGTAIPQSTTVNIASLISQNEYNPFIPFNSTYKVYVPSVGMYVYQYPWFYDTVYGYQNTYDYNSGAILTVDVANYGHDDATGVVVKEVIGNGFEYDGCTTQGAGTAIYDPTTRTITWDIGNMPVNGEVWMMVMVKAIQSGDETTALTSTASISHVDQYDVPNNYKTASYSIIVPTSVDIQVSQNYTTNTISGSQYVTYTINTTNNGPDNATGVAVTDMLPNGLQYVSSTASAGTYNPTTGVWNIGSITDGTNQTLTITAKVTGTGNIRNTATVTAEDQNDWNYNDKQTNLTI